jgi:hypothetical protein
LLQEVTASVADPVPGKNSDAAPVPCQSYDAAPSPSLLNTMTTFLKQAKVNIRVTKIYSLDFF